MPKSKFSKLFKGIGKVATREVRGKTSKSRQFPRDYEIRKGQSEFIEEAFEAIKNSKIFLGSAPCGIGKSIASLLAVLPQLEDNKLIISFRTRNQLHIYLKELKALASNLPAVSFFSKQNMCPLRVKGDLSYVDFFEECKRLKDNCESSTKPYCKFFWNTIRKKKEAEQLALNCAQKLLTPMESVKLLSKQGFCAYEALKRVLNKVNIFLGTYHYVFNSKIREVMLKSLGVDLTKVYLIIDEAHNLPLFSRELLSDRLTTITIDRALNETKRFEHKALQLVREYLNVLDKEVFQRGQQILRKEKLKQLNPQKVSDLFLEKSGVSGSEAAEILREYGQHVKETRQELGHERIFSYNQRVGEFLENFFQKMGEKYIHLVKRDPQGRINLEVRSFDGREITDPVLRQTHGSILMSGFLSPPKIYRDLMLYERNDVYLREFDSPFPPENRLILIAEDVSSRFEKRTNKMLDRWKDYIEAIFKANEGNVAVFFTSYGLMRAVLSLIKTDRDMAVEQRKTRRDEVMSQLTESDDNALFGVMGGKFSEGIDYPNNLLTCVVSVGLPYATWNVYQKALIKYFDQQFPENGRMCAYLAPAILRLIQTCGRVHRSTDDRGCIVILDERISHPNIKQQLPSYYQKEMITIRSPIECANQIKEFWKEPHNARL
ncbi:ATP-dependent DNA helicase [Candidatus Bathyarchaeota archaeon]|nr:ATP-dependent DNA helicase [Candidatus Bathyarchaeota archaeon]